VASAAGGARRYYPLLPPGLEDRALVADRLGAVAGDGLSVAAWEGRRLVGLLAPLAVELWGGLGAWVPEWGHAGPPSLVAAMYAAAVGRWAEAGLRTQAVTLWACQPEVEAAWHALGFGRVVVDALRGLEPFARRPRGVTIRPAESGDSFTLTAMQRALWEHLAAPPVSRVAPPAEGRVETARRLADPARPVWLAEVEGAAVGFVSLAPSDEGPAVLRSPEVVRCDGAFVVPERRGRGVASALIGAALRWAAGAGFHACALDFESANVSAAGFWMAAGFVPVLHSVARRLA
jgi:GNAT superfamily N-acetyltransferase